jgi:lipopolysaccharide/colanic/teichoic acid biosynthesis glycosyltransferase
MIARASVRMLHSERDVGVRPGPAAAQHVIIIGSNRLSSLYISFLRAYAPEQYRIIASLDDRPEMIGRSVAGVRVLGPINHLLPIIEDFKDHGIPTDRILVGGDPDMLTAEASIEIQRICNEYGIRLDFIPRLIGLSEVQQVTAPTRVAVAAISAFSPPHYFRTKRVVDFCLSLVLIVVLLPVFVIVATLVLLDTGSPVFFWQRRIGRNGHRFQINKFRTLKPSYDWQAQPLSSAERLSWLGALVRKVRLDELPQLLNVLVGDMSLIGPRPLLPRDQPPDPTVRLSVRPGITGWAQVHGGTSLTPEEKNVLDEWYVRNASIWIDLKIIAKTIASIFKDERWREPQPELRETYTNSKPAPHRQSSVHGT